MTPILINYIHERESLLIFGWHCLTGTYFKSFTLKHNSSLRATSIGFFRRILTSIKWRFRSDQYIFFALLLLLIVSQTSFTFTYIGYFLSYSIWFCGWIIWKLLPLLDLLMKTLVLQSPTGEMYQVIRPFSKKVFKLSSFWKRNKPSLFSLNHDTTLEILRCLLGTRSGDSTAVCPQESWSNHWNLRPNRTLERRIQNTFNTDISLIIYLYWEKNIYF